MPGDDARSYAVICLAQSGDVRDSSDCAHPAFRGANHAARRSVSGGPFLRHTGGWLRSDLDALLLDLRTSRSVRLDYSFLRLHVRNHSGVFPKTDFWIPRHGWSNSLYRLPEHERMGAPHIHNRDELLCQQLFRDYQYGHRGSDGNQNLQLDRNYVGRE